MRVRGTLGRHHELHSDAGASLLPPVRLQRERRRYGEVESRSETHKYYSYIWQPMHCLYDAIKDKGFIIKSGPKHQSYTFSFSRLKLSQN